MDDELVLRLSQAEAMVLHDWLARSADAGAPAPFVDAAEPRLLGDLLALLDEALSQTLRANPEALLRAARGRVREG